MSADADAGTWAGAQRTMRRAPRRSAIARAIEWTRPYLARARGEGYFADGVDAVACRVIHDHARRQTLYRFAPPPPLRLVVDRDSTAGGETYAFRSPFVSHLRARNDAFVAWHRGARGRPLVVFNALDAHVGGRFVAESLVPALLAGGVDVALPTPPGVGARRAPEDRRRGWAHTVGAALSAIAQLVHDNVAIEAWARERGYRVAVASGIGAGGTVAAVLAATTTRFDAYVPICAGAHPGRAWIPPRPLARAVHGGALGRAGVRDRRALARLFDPVAPIRLPAPRPTQRCALVALRHDTVVPAPDVDDLASHWQRPVQWLPYGRGDLTRRVRELAAAVVRAALARDGTAAE